MEILLIILFAPAALFVGMLLLQVIGNMFVAIVESPILWIGGPILVLLTMFCLHITSV